MRRASFPLIILGCLLVLAALFTNNLAAHAYTDAQAQAGRTLFSQRCQGCHGANGEGVRAPKVAGNPDLLSRYGTAGALSNKIKTTMPPNAPGSLSDADALAATAFIMSLNGIAADGTALTTANANSVALRAAAAPAPAAPAAPATTSAPTTTTTQLPRTGEEALPVGLAAAGILAVAAGIALRRRTA